MSCLTGRRTEPLIHGNEERKSSGWERGLRPFPAAQADRLAFWTGLGVEQKWGEEKVQLLSPGRYVCCVADWKKEEGDLSHVLVSFQAEFKVIPLAQIEKILFPTCPNIPAEDMLVSQKGLGRRKEGKASTEHLCYQWSAPGTGWWGNKLLKTSPACKLLLGLPLDHCPPLSTRIHSTEDRAIHRHCLSTLHVTPAHPKLNFMLL